jgi:hypothetical protein
MCSSWNERHTPAERAAEDARVAEAIAQRQRDSEQIRYDAMVDVLIDVGNLAEKWSQNR